MAAQNRGIRFAMLAWRTNPIGTPRDRWTAKRGGARIAPACLLGAIAAATIGCGTTRWTNSPRTGTELLLISDAIDRSIDAMDFGRLAGEAVFLDSQYLSGTLDEGYIVSSLRQKLLASGCILKENRDEAKYVVEARSGGVGTDQHDVTFGIPSVNIPPILGSVGGVPASIPEVPLIKKTAQKGVAKLAIFAYARETGRAVWQSGATPVDSTAKDTWVFGAGPFQRGTIYDGPKFAGSRLPVPTALQSDDQSRPPNQDWLSVTSHAVFLEKAPQDNAVQVADHKEPISDNPSRADQSATTQGR